MTRDELLASIITAERFNRITQPGVQQQKAVEQIRAVIDWIKAEDRSPDLWESWCLSAAIGYRACGQYASAIHAVRSACSQPDQRSTSALPDSPTSIHRLEQGLRAVDLLAHQVV